MPGRFICILIYFTLFTVIVLGLLHREYLDRIVPITIPPPPPLLLLLFPLFWGEHDCLPVSTVHLNSIEIHAWHMHHLPFIWVSLISFWQVASWKWWICKLLALSLQFYTYGYTRRLQNTWCCGHQAGMQMHFWLLAVINLYSLGVTHSSCQPNWMNTQLYSSTREA